MSRSKRVMNFHIENSEHLIRLMEALTNLKADLDVNSSSSSVEICVYGDREKIKGICKRIRGLIEKTKPK
ncbi:hypothetical protein AKJ45_03805 [candidate division MSBL1 archaeon SCGC-AAA261F19]|uniref:Uncharacterized protein n=1 Tax=candidate division MSBL1 archaeon SCGC-AAA261F19 TaxID=1698275 RepID=A0A133V6A2_9EURY|nr:hypothetical protein AKJ45_03805 [candidate division MSBL1 archaeon SCGC-AAA261F19]